MRLAAQSPLLLMIDDLHWADRSSLLLARRLAQATALGRVLMLGTFRDTELSERHPLSLVLADLERERPLQRIRLLGLRDEEVAELVGAHGQGLEADTVRAIREETHGNPLFVKQLLRHLEEEGQSTRPEGGFGLSAGLRDVIARRVAHLPEEAGRVLRVAALIGRDFEIGVVEGVVDLDEDELLDLLDAAVRAGILVEVASTPGRYSFVHALLRTALEDELTDHTPGAPAPPDRRGDREPSPSAPRRPSRRPRAPLRGRGARGGRPGRGVRGAGGGVGQCAARV